jgi:hypothetical protein
VNDNHSIDGQIQEIKRQVAAGDYSELGKLARLECRCGDHVWENWRGPCGLSNSKGPSGVWAGRPLHREVSERFFGKDYQRTHDHMRLMKRECFWCGIVERFYSIELFNGGNKQLVEVRI